MERTADGRHELIAELGMRFAEAARRVCTPEFENPRERKRIPHPEAETSYSAANLDWDELSESKRKLWAPNGIEECCGAVISIAL